MKKMLVDYHVHAMGHDDFPHTPEQAAEFLAKARERGIAQVGFADHDRYRKKFNLEALKRAAELVPGVAVKLGVEVNYRPEDEPKIRHWLQRYPFDFVIGSVHDIGDWVFDHPGNVDTFDRWDPDKLYRTYFGVVERAAQSGLFSFIGHLDLIKVFGHRSRSPVADLIDPTLRMLARLGMPVEINTNGWHKPVNEVYPSEDILRRCFDYGVPITLSSDAHNPGQVGRDVERAAEMARGVGYRQVITFNRLRAVVEEL